MFAFAHNNFNVSNLDRSLKFYQEALGLEVLRRYEGSDFTQCWLGDHGASMHELELTWNWDEEDILDLGDEFSDDASAGDDGSSGEDGPDSEDMAEAEEIPDGDEE